MEQIIILVKMDAAVEVQNSVDLQIIVVIILEMVNANQQENYAF